MHGFSSRAQRPCGRDFATRTFRSWRKFVPYQTKQGNNSSSDGTFRPVSTQARQTLLTWHQVLRFPWRSLVVESVDMFRGEEWWNFSTVLKNFSMFPAASLLACHAQRQTGRQRKLASPCETHQIAVESTWLTPPSLGVPGLCLSSPTSFLRCKIWTDDIDKYCSDEKYCTAQIVARAHWNNLCMRPLYLFYLCFRFFNLTKKN